MLGSVRQCVSRFVLRGRNLSNCVKDELPPFIRVSEEVQECLFRKSPVVALESTVITHGLPFPENINTARSLQQEVYANGCTPATIAVLNGKVLIGLSESELEQISRRDGGKLSKVSERELPFVISQRLSGGTTVSATASLAYRAGIRVFATGGIGGVHRGGEHSLDISSDLNCLSRTPLTIVSAGVKSILDIGRSLEYLETQGVVVTVWGSSKDFPAFLSPCSGHLAPSCVADSQQAAHLIETRDAMGLRSAVLLAVPYFGSGWQERAKVIEEATHQALEDARVRGVLGKDVTPFVLDRLHHISGGVSLQINCDLLRQNAKIGSQVALELARRNFSPADVTNLTSSADLTKRPQNPVVVIGGSNVDIITTVSQDKIQMQGGTFSGDVSLSPGGVGLNVAHCLGRLGHHPLFISAAGEDHFRQILLHGLSSHLDCKGIRPVKSCSTAKCNVILNEKKECMFMVGDMQAHHQVSPDWISGFAEDIKKAPLVVFDGNIPLESVELITTLCDQNNVPVWFEPTDVYKAGCISGSARIWPLVTFASPNVHELRTMAANHQPDANVVNRGAEEDLISLIRLSLPLMSRMHTLVVTLGPRGVLLLTRNPKRLPLKHSYPDPQAGPIRAFHYPALEGVERIVSVSGAGDCFAGAMIGGILQGLSTEDAVRAGLGAARLSLTSHLCVPDTVHPNTLQGSQLTLEPIQISF